MSIRRDVFQLTMILVGMLALAYAAFLMGQSRPSVEPLSFEMKPIHQHSEVWI